MNLVEMARASGMAIILDGRIGREEYQSVHGSLAALQRLADAIRVATVNERGHERRARKPAGHTCYPGSPRKCF